MAGATLRHGADIPERVIAVDMARRGQRLARRACIDVAYLVVDEVLTRERTVLTLGFVDIDPRSFGLFKAAYSVKETLDLLSIGRTKFYELVDQGDLKINKLGTKSLVYVTDIVALLTKLRGPAADN